LYAFGDVDFELSFARCSLTAINQVNGNHTVYLEIAHPTMIGTPHDVFPFEGCHDIFSGLSIWFNRRHPKSLEG
jgi:hypothetical protein